MRILVLAATLASAVLPASMAEAHPYRDRSDYREYQREVRHALRECRRDLRRADSRREYRRERRDCRRDLREARREYRRDLRDNRYGYYDRGYQDRSRYWDGYRWRSRW